MKKTIKSLLAIAVAAFAFTACSDVPTPEGYNPNQGDNVYPFNPTGAGTKEDPYTTADGIAYAKSLNMKESTNSVFIKGKVVAVTEEFTTQYGNGTFTISDDGTSANGVFTCFRVLYLGNKKFASGDTQIKVGDDVVIYGKVVNYKGNTPETVQNTAFLYSLNGVDRGGEGGGGGETADQPKGTGTVDNPFNVAAAVAKCKEAGETATTEEYYIKGKVKTVTEEFTTNYGNGTFTIVDNGFTQIFTAYRVLYLGNKKWATGDTQIKEGDEVIIKAKIMNFKGNTPETSGGFLYSLNGNTGGGGGGAETADQPKGNGTQGNPFNVAGAVAKCKEVGETATAEEYYVTGVADADCTIADDNYKNATFDMVDAGFTQKFKAFRVLAPEGKKLKAGYKIPKGATVVVYAKLVNYKGDTPETVQTTNPVYNGTLVSVNGQAPEVDDGTSGGGGESGGGQGGGGATELTNGNFETWASGLPTGWKSASSASSATLEQSTDAHSGSYSCNVKGDEANNKRLASQEITLAAGSYTFSFWVKATTTDASQARPGMVPITDGKAGSYSYGNYATLSTSWQQVSYDFTLTSETTVCLVVMNPKKSSYSSGKDILVDDATLTKK